MTTAQNELTQSKCVPCQGGVEPLTGEALDKLAENLSKEWKIIDEHHLEREFKFDDFKQALDFVNKVGQLAEEQNHHPDIYFTWGKAKISLRTHKIDGLHKNDFIMAAKIDQL